MRAIHTRAREAEKARYGRVDDVVSRYSIGKSTARKIGQEAGAVVKIGRAALYDYQKIDKYLEQLRERGR